MRLGVEVLLSDLGELRRRRVGLLTNWASFCRWRERYVPSFQAFRELSSEGVLELVRIFSPQHGLWMQRQANMLEWEGGEELGVEVFSLYGRHRKPPPESLRDLDVLLVDLQDVGARYYTYVWTLRLTMEACAQARLKLLVLDRPNPIGRAVEGPILNRDHFSFVGMAEVPIRHGMTVGELALLMKEAYEIRVDVEVVRMDGWSGEGWPEELPWVPPSPNMPSLDTALVYPGACLLEATNVSEGRGTTRPFEMVGAPEVDPFTLSQLVLDWAGKLGLKGFQAYPTRFVPTFDKHRGRELAGIVVLVTDREAFKPVRAYLLILRAFKTLWKDFRWLLPPYEYEYSKMPIDILWGSPLLRELMDSSSPLDSWRGLFRALEEDEEGFRVLRENFLLY